MSENKTHKTHMTDTAKNVSFQACADLTVENLYAKNFDTLGSLMQLQKNIQETVYGYDFTALQNGPLRELKAFIDWNEEAIRDEQREFANALGGIHSHSNALWKPWKSKHVEAGNKTLKNLTAEELLELKYEAVDQLHFIFNIFLAIGLEEKELFNLYYAKNKENRNRQNKPDGY
jgi:hypothetical protein